jgi:hypothetical protein
MEQIMSYLLSPETIPAPYSTVLMVLEGVFLFVSIAFIVLIFLVLLKTKRLAYRFLEDANEFTKFRPYEVDKQAKNWKRIIKKLDSGLESEYKLAVIESDIMLEEVLKRIGHIEETIEEKVNATTSTELGNIEEVKRARKVRNDIVYDPDYSLSLDKAKETLKVYEEAFRNLNVIS